jgi:uncharacterized protein YjiS (DUF1127 family)
MTTKIDRQDELFALRQAAERHRSQVLATMLAALPKAVARVYRAVVNAVRRSIEREQLLALDDRTLRDIGISRLDVYEAYRSKGAVKPAANENRPVRVA